MLKKYFKLLFKTGYSVFFMALMFFSTMVGCTNEVTNEITNSSTSSSEEKSSSNSSSTTTQHESSSSSSNKTTSSSNFSSSSNESSSSSSDTSEQGDSIQSEYYIFTEVEGGYSIKLKKMPDTTIISIPDNYNDVPIVEIADYGFKDFDEITEIIIPNSVTTIRFHAFEHCASLIRVTIPCSVTSIGYQAFSECDFLERVDYEGSISQWASIKFDYDANPLSMKKLYINGVLFQEENIVLEGITAIGSYAFFGCSFIKNIKIPNSVTSIGASAFSECDSLERVDYEGSISQWASITFGNYNANPLSMKKLYINGALFQEENIILEEITSIGAYAFSGCDSIKSIEIPNSVASIGTQAFRDCSSLTNLYIPKSVINVGNYLAWYDDPITFYCEVATEPSGWENYNWNGFRPFYFDIKKEDIIIQDELQYLITSEKNVVVTGFTNELKSNLVIPSEIVINNQQYKVTSIGQAAFYRCQSITSITISNSITNIENYAFEDCDSLTSVIIPNSVLKIGDYAFGDCNSLTIYCEVATKPNEWSFNWNRIEGDYYKYYCPVYWGISDNNYLEQDGIIYVIIDEVANITGYTNKIEKNVVIPTNITINKIQYNVTNINSLAFYRCNKIQSVTFESNSNLKNINEFAFAYCNFLESITIPNGVKTIGNYAFEHCASLIRVTIPCSVTSIGYQAFSECDSLERVDYEGSISQWVSIKFGSYNANPLSMKKLYINGALFQEENIVLEGITSIGAYAFSKCDFIKSIEIPNSVTSIGTNAFYNCTSLKNIKIPNSVTSIGKSTFSGCTSLTIYCEASSQPQNWSEGWNYDNRQVFWNINNSIFQDGLQFLIVDGKAIIIGGGYKESIVIPTTIMVDGQQYDVTSIETYAFYNCSTITAIYIPNSITTIEIDAFLNCGSLTIYCEAESKPSGWHGFWKNNNILCYWGINKNNCVEQDGIIYVIEDGNAIITGHANSLEGKVVIPEKITINNKQYDVVKIAKLAFSNCNFTSIELSKSIVEIGDKAFSNCKSLKSIVIPSNVLIMGDYVFYDCQLVIYCEVENTLVGWSYLWNYKRGAEAYVYYLSNEWSYVDDVPTPNN